MNTSLANLPSRAEQIFFRPARQYPWDDIVTGAKVLSRLGQTRIIPAVGTNTFRGFHRLDKAGEGPQETFVTFFLSEKQHLIRQLGKVKTPEGLHQLSNCIIASLTARLKNIRPDQLHSFNKVRKPVDLYLEHLVSMAEELAAYRSTLVPCLFLPLDSWILDHPNIFSEGELLHYGLSRGLSFSDITKEPIYLALQNLAQAKTRILSAQLKSPFHRIYYDLFWNNRFRNWGENLFETNP